MSNKDCRYDVMVFDDIDDYDIEPLDDYVLLKIALPKKETSGGLIVSSRENTDEANRRIVGVIEKTGKNVDWVEQGDTVMFNQFSGTVVLRKASTETESGYEYRLMAEKVLICRMKRKEGK